MAKQPFQDIIPPDRRSIKKIPIPERRRPQFSEHVPPIPHIPQSQPDVYIKTPQHEDTYASMREEAAPRLAVPEPRRTRPVRPGSKSKVVVMLLIAVAVIAGAVYYMSGTTSALVTVTPKQQEVSVDAQFTALKDATDENLQYQTVSISKDGKMTVQSNGQEYANDKASGTIVIYNDYSTASQRLIANTRFETKDGLIFRISQPVDVPGRKGDTPGSLEVPVTADEPGPKYNVGLQDFTIPGFKGDPRYEKIYARSKIPLQGGFTGNKPKVAPTDLETARTKINSELKAELVRQIEKDIPHGYVMPGNAFVVVYEPLANSQDQANNVEINQRATLHGVIFKRTDLAREIVAKADAMAEGQIDIANPQNLLFTLQTGTSTAGISASQIAFSLKGMAELIAVVDTASLKRELAGKPRNSLTATLAGYPAIIKAEVIMRPFWKTTFPDNEESIEIAIDSIDELPGTE